MKGRKMAGLKPPFASQRRIVALGIWVLVLTGCSSTDGSSSSDVPVSAPPERAATASLPGGNRPTPAPTDSALRLDGQVIRYTGDVSEAQPGDFVAVDPSTGETITLLEATSNLLADDLVNLAADVLVARVAASADGRWVAFEGTFCPDRQGVGEGRLWVANGIDEPRPLVAPCAESEGLAQEGRWAWSPTGSRLAVVVRSPGDAPALILIDPETAHRTDLGKPAGDVTSLTWSPDGTRIAYAASPTGSADGTRKGSVYTVSVDGGDHTVIAESLGYVPGGEEGAGIAWSPDGTRIAVLADAGPGYPRGTLYVMTADGSGRQPLAEGVLIEHILGSPNIVWSPDGTRIAYATESDEYDHLRIWSTAPDGSTPVLVFDDAAGHANALVGGPVWSPDGARIAFRNSTAWPDMTWLVADADGSGNVHEIDELQPLSWRGGWYFCECYG